MFSGNNHQSAFCKYTVLQTTSRKICGLSSAQNSKTIIYQYFQIEFMKCLLIWNLNYTFIQNHIFSTELLP